MKPLLTVLLIGSGGREHAMAWKLAQSQRVTRLIVAPGNAGMSRTWERWPVTLERESFAALAARARAEKVDLAVIGPDNPLADGIVDLFESQGIPTFGPTAQAARIESSKSFAKDVMKRAGVPTAEHVVAPEADEALKFLRSAPWPPRQGQGWVIKADGLAFGKGVRVCENFEEARHAVLELPKGPLVIEERLRGAELSWLAFCDGNRCALLEPARDYKRLRDGDQGPNTGGMGAFSPVPGIPADWPERVRQEVFLPTLREMKKRGAPFKGVLYAGLMADFARDRFWVIEFNARFGDPEAQVLLPRMADDLAEWCEAVAAGDLGSLPECVPFRADAAVTVVAAAAGYPESPRKGDRIRGLLPTGAPPGPGTVNLRHFAAGVAASGDADLVTAGGRVLNAVGMGKDLASARTEAYRALEETGFDGMQYRSDVALFAP